ncbi:MAG: DUF2314 domain-containing protein [Myxococcaceae bacterium]|nr:DUF2314 domain-containing protein [Myxococcaceae bacterium]MCI0673365.1 DUF2314 domain-containing protein [Myxococcaceae bacterium]
MKEVYIIATAATAPVEFSSLEEELDADALVFTGDEEGWGFQLQTELAAVDVRFEVRDAPLGWTPDLLTGSGEALEVLRQARGFYRVAFEAREGQPAMAVVEALVCARAILERSGGVLLDVTAFKLHDAQDVADIVDLDFDIRDHVDVHVQKLNEGDTPLWVHTHGMEKFGARNLELFHLGEQDLEAAEGFLQELCTDLALGQGAEAGSLVETSEGESFLLAPSEEARVKLMGIPLEVFEGHEGPFLTVVSPEGRHTAAELLKPYRERFAEEAPERAAELRSTAQRLLAAFKARFQRRGLMEPLAFLVRAPFETHPEGPEGAAVPENLWVEVLTWEDASVLGRLVDGATHTTEWRKGAQVEVEESQLNALLVSREGRALDDDELVALLDAERPS